MISNAMEPDHLILMGFVEMEAGLLNFLCNPRHVGHAPWHHDVVRLLQMRMNFAQEMLVAFREQVIKKLFLKTGRGGSIAPIATGFRRSNLLNERA